MFRILLFPFAILYDMATSIRNRLYDQGLKPSTSFEVSVISVGNLNMGGTGKTPMVEYLIRLLTPGFKIATLSRGYGRKTSGFRVASESENPSTIGDEPFQLFQKFGPAVKVVVGEERAFAIPNIVSTFPETDVIIMDDGFQHRKVRPGFQILLSDFNRPFYDDYLFPAGRLREARKGAARADVIVITKCPRNISDEKAMEVEDQVRRYSDKPVFFGAIRYGSPIAFGGIAKIREEVVLVTGIANTRDLEDFVASHFKIVRHLNFQDHHAYSAGDVKKITDIAKAGNAMVLTTEKDAVKLSGDDFQALRTDVPFFYLPIELELLKNGKEFDEMVLNVVKSPNAP